MESKPLITTQSTLLVTGGAKGITAECILHLAQICPCNFILLGRSQILESLPEWAQESADPALLKRNIMEDFRSRGEKPDPRMIEKTFQAYQSHHQISRTLAALRQSGSQVVYVAADVTRREELKKELSAPIRKFGKVDGVIHGAGSLADKLIEKKTLTDFDKVYAPKITGLKNILEIIPPENLDFIALFSSVVGFFGNAGQSDYAIANEILNKTSYKLIERYPHLRVISFNWGPWEGGMVSEEHKKAFAEKGISLITRRDGAAVFTEALLGKSSPSGQLLVGKFPARPKGGIPPAGHEYKIHRKLNRQENPFLEDHVIAGRPVLPATCGAAWMANTCEQLFPGYVFQRLEDFRVLKGIVFEEGMPGEYLITVKTLPETGGGKIYLESSVTSQKDNGKTQYQYRQKLVLGENQPAPVEYESAGISGASIKGSALYADGTLFHGPSFQGVVEVMGIDQTGLQMMVCHPHLPAWTQGQFAAQTVNPFINDAVVQCLLIWTQKMDGAPCLPSSAKKLEQYLPLHFDRLYTVDLKIVSHTATAVFGDIAVSDENGQLCMRITALEGTISRQLGRFISAKSPGKSA